MSSSHPQPEQSQPTAVIQWDALPDEIKEFFEALADSGMPFEIEQNGERRLLMVERIAKDRPVDEPIVVLKQS